MNDSVQCHIFSYRITCEFISTPKTHLGHKDGGNSGVLSRGIKQHSENIAHFVGGYLILPHIESGRPSFSICIVKLT